MSVWFLPSRKKTHFIKATQPTTSDGPIEVGTLWSDTGNALLKRCTSTAPVTFVSVEGGGAGLSDGDYGDITVGGTGTTMTIDDGVVTYAKLQDVSATDKVLGRSTAGAGDVEEIACTAAGRALLDDASAGDQRTTLGLGTIATQNANNVSISGGAVTGITDLAIADGGTGASTATAAFDALAPTTTQGDIIYHNGTDNVRLAKGTAFQILRMNSGATAPTYAPPHVALVFFGSINTWTDMPAAKTEIYGATLRHEVDLTTYSQVRLLAFVGVAGAAGAVIYAEYSTNGGVGWATLSDSISLTSASHARTAWATIPAGALADDVVVRVVGESGNGAADPIIGNVEVQLR